jgi:hypothetical protein
MQRELLQKRAACEAEQPTPQNGWEPFVVSGDDDIATLQFSQLCELKGIQPLTGYRFGLRGRNLLPNSGWFQYVFKHIIAALWACEVCILIAQRPPDLYYLLHGGNYHAISKLTGKFYFYSNPLEYVLELGRFLSSFVANKALRAEYLTAAVNNFDAMAVTSDRMSPESIEQMNYTIEAMERGEVSTILPVASLQIVRRAIAEKKSFKEMGTGVMEVFAGCPPPMHRYYFGLIRESEMKTRL